MSRLYPLRTRFQRDVGEIENYFETYSRRHPHVTCTMLRYQSTIGPSVDTQVTRYLSLPVVPDLPRLRPAAAVHPRAGRGRRLRRRRQAARARRGQRRRRGHDRADPHDPPGGQAQPAAGRPRLRAGRRRRAPARAVPFSPDFRRLLRYGRGVDVSRLIEEVGFRPAYSMEDAVADYVATQQGRRLAPTVRQAVASR